MVMSCAGRTDFGPLRMSQLRAFQGVDQQFLKHDQAMYRLVMKKATRSGDSPGHKSQYGAGLIDWLSRCLSRFGRAIPVASGQTAA
ncbi:hypothetical protein MJO28_003487 [Puccinia striiformis f. sp. tritici]|uniref:Uncharacterized protein n=1 Tax=Puccinia striiformis f. sp. tritici TaxID=168172 RepID=A0ACC0ESL5_9BASI|nr:hypothetical protein MJO28_003487 [Puccinia striiformis f. sp. tritici]